MALTPRQESVYRVICEYHRRNGFSPTVREICEHLGLSSPAGVHRVLGVLKEAGYIRSASGKKRAWRPVEQGALYDMPVAGRIAAGRPLDVWENPDERVPVDPAFYGHEGCFAVRVTGDSMLGVHIREGDLAVIRPQQNVENGEIAAVLVEGLLTEATLKIVRKARSLLELHSANPDYPPLCFKGRARGRVKIVGKYVGLIRKGS